MIDSLADCLLVSRQLIIKLSTIYNFYILNFKQVLVKFIE